MALPNVEETEGRFAFSVMNKGKLKCFVWVWMERIDPKKARVPNPKMLAVRVENLGQRNAMLAAEPVKFFTEPHYAGFPAILVRLEEVTVADLKVLIAEAWRTQAPVEKPGAKAKAKVASERRATAKTKRR